MVIFVKISVICVGKIKEQYYRDAIAEYSKRLSRYCKLDIVEVADEKTPEHASETVVQMIKEKEGGRVRKYLREDAYIIALDIDGKMLDSVELSDQIEQLGNRSVAHIIFLIGGSLGMQEELLRQADMRLSFSKMTFPHQLMRVILLEQIYRAYRIANHEPYHK